MDAHTILDSTPRTERRCADGERAAAHRCDRAVEPPAAVQTDQGVALGQGDPVAARRHGPLRFLSVAEAARVMGVGEDVVRGLMDRHDLAHHRFPGRITRYTTEAAILAYQQRVIDDCYGRERSAPQPIGRRRGRA